MSWLLQLLDAVPRGSWPPSIFKASNSIQPSPCGITLTLSLPLLLSLTHRTLVINYIEPIQKNQETRLNSPSQIQLVSNLTSTCTLNSTLLCKITHCKIPRIRTRASFLGGGSIFMPSRDTNITRSSKSFYFYFLKIFIYLFLERGEGREKDRKRNINVWLPLACPLLGTWPATQACALTGNRAGDSLVHRLALSPLSHTS